MRKQHLIEYLLDKIESAENSAEELIQELNNEEEGDKQLAKAEAFKEVLEYIKQPHI